MKQDCQLNRNQHFLSKTNITDKVKGYSPNHKKLENQLSLERGYSPRSPEQNYKDNAGYAEFNNKYFPSKQHVCKGQSPNSNYHYSIHSSNSPIVQYYAGMSSPSRDRDAYSPEDSYSKRDSKHFMPSFNQIDGIQNYNFSPSALFNSSNNKQSCNSSTRIENVSVENHQTAGTSLQEKIESNLNVDRGKENNIHKILPNDSSSSGVENRSSSGSEEDSDSEKGEEKADSSENENPELYMLSFNSDVEKEEEENSEEDSEVNSSLNISEKKSKGKSKSTRKREEAKEEKLVQSKEEEKVSEVDHFEDKAELSEKKALICQVAPQEDIALKNDKTPIEQVKPYYPTNIHNYPYMTNLPKNNHDLSPQKFSKSNPSLQYQQPPQYVYQPHQYLQQPPQYLQQPPQYLQQPPQYFQSPPLYPPQYQQYHQQPPQYPHPQHYQSYPQQPLYPPQYPQQPPPLQQLPPQYPNYRPNYQPMPQPQPHLPQNVNAQPQIPAQSPKAKKCKKMKRLDPESYLNQPFEELAKNIFFIAKDQGGCRYLQKKIDEDPSQTLKILYPAIKPYFLKVIFDPFGNYLIQKIFPTLKDEQVQEVLSLISPQIADIGADSHGTRVIQQLISFLKTQKLQETFWSIIKPYVIPLLNELNGTHIIQKFSNDYPYYSPFITSIVIENCLTLATHRHGCCVLQKYLENANREVYHKFIKKLLANCLMLIVDQFGNYVIQSILFMKNVVACNEIASKLLENVCYYSKHKYSSNVVEKCFDYCDEAHRQRLIETVAKPEVVNDLILNEHGNYVVQKVLSCSDIKTQNAILQFIVPLYAKLKNLPFGERIISRLLFSYPQLNEVMAVDEGRNPKGWYTAKKNEGNSLKMNNSNHQKKKKHFKKKGNGGGGASSTNPVNSNLGMNHNPSPISVNSSNQFMGEYNQFPSIISHHQSSTD